MDEAEPTQAAVRRVDYSPRQVSGWLTRPSDEWPTQPVNEYMNALLAACPMLRQVRKVALSFKTLLKTK